MAELKQDAMHPLKHEQCYLCIMTLVENPPGTRPSPCPTFAARTRNTWPNLKTRDVSLARACSRTIKRMKRLGSWLRHVHLAR